ncbi:uncharacterized protein [Parasteatoda tepidariorum]|uniref:F-box only protein 21 n=1 Tax=Parasteatoda tepidariorum TaxID=114398 RepID=A0A2L2Y1S9_PARTP|nr:uncharacterized protein LOC107442400 [Parasteatoda tepidariorum]
MTLTFSDVLIFFVLCTCVPLQYFLVNNWGNVESSRSYAINKLITRITNFYDEYLTLESWKKWVSNLLDIDYGAADTSLVLDDLGESPALEVLRFKQKDGYFGFSQEPRLLRHPNVKYRVGQVVRHRKWNYRGVIIGWDEKARAPIEWLEQMHGKENPHWRDMPNYSILVDTRDRLIPQLTYVPQENIEIITDTQVIHPMIELHFERFDGIRYLPRPWFQAVYPQD